MRVTSCESTKNECVWLIGRLRSARRACSSRLVGHPEARCRGSWSKGNRIVNSLTRPLDFSREPTIYTVYILSDRSSCARQTLAYSLLSRALFTARLVDPKLQVACGGTRLCDELLLFLGSSGCRSTHKLLPTCTTAINESRCSECEVSTLFGFFKKSTRAPPGPHSAPCVVFNGAQYF